MIKIDVRGLSCPQPVLLVQKEINEGNGNFEILLDSEASRENILRILEKNRLKSEIIEEDDTILCKVIR